jgi:hypothetical protein
LPRQTPSSKWALLSGSHVTSISPSYSSSRAKNNENRTVVWRNGWSHSPHNCPAKKKMADYFCANFHLTTSGNFRTQALMNAMLEIGADRIMFSVDYPFESCADAAGWFDATAISEPDRIKIGRTNALQLFRLPY